MNEIDFLPKRIRQQRGVHRQLRHQAIGVVLAACALGAVGYFHEVRIAEAKTDLRATVVRGEQLSRELEVLPELTAQLAEGQIKRRISRELGSRLTINALLAELARMLPADSSLTSLECSTIEVRPPVEATKGRRPRRTGKAARQTPALKRVRLQITGVAPTAVDVADFIGRLSVSPLFADVNMGYAKTVLIDGGSREARSFQVSFLVAR